MSGWVVAFPGHTLHGGAANRLGMHLWLLHCYASVAKGFIHYRKDDEGRPLQLAGVSPNETCFPGPYTLVVGGAEHTKDLQKERPSSEELRDYIRDVLIPLL